MAFYHLLVGLAQDRWENKFGRQKILLLFHFEFSPPSDDDDDDDDDVGEPCLYSCSCCGHLASPPLGLNEVLLLNIILSNNKMI